MHLKLFAVEQFVRLGKFHSPFGEFFSCIFFVVADDDGMRERAVGIETNAIFNKYLRKNSTNYTFLCIELLNRQ